MSLHTQKSHDLLITQCKIIREVLMGYRNLMAEVKMDFSVDTSPTDKLFHAGIHALGVIMAEAKGLYGEEKDNAAEDG